MFSKIGKDFREQIMSVRHPKTFYKCLLHAVLIGACLAAFALPTTVAAKEKPSYLPFPDVWARVIPYPWGIRSPRTIATPVIDANGRILIPYGYSLDEGGAKESEYLLVYDFFADKIVIKAKNGEPVPHDESGAEYEFPDVHDFQPLPLVMGKDGNGQPLADGSRFMRETPDDATTFIGPSLAKVDANGAKIFEKMIVLLGEIPVFIDGDPEGDHLKGRPGAFVRNRSIVPIIYQLPDGTFLIQSIGDFLVLRIGDTFQQSYDMGRCKALLLDPDKAIAAHHLIMASAAQVLEQIRMLNRDQPWAVVEFADILMRGRLEELLQKGK